MAQQGDVADTGDDKKENRASEDDDGESRRRSKSTGDDIFVVEVLRDVPPRTLALLGQVEGVQGQGVDGRQ